MLKDHEIDQLVNELTDCAREYGQSEQLRARISQIVTTKLKAPAAVFKPPFVTGTPIEERKICEPWKETKAAAASENSWDPLAFGDMTWRPDQKQVMPIARRDGSPVTGLVVRPRLPDVKPDHEGADTARMADDVLMCRRFT